MIRHHFIFPKIYCDSVYIVQYWITFRMSFYFKLRVKCSNFHNSFFFSGCSVAAQTPTQNAAQLKNDIRLLIIFWNTLFSDVKYIKKEIFSSIGKHLCKLFFSVSSLTILIISIVETELNLESFQQILSDNYKSEMAYK